MRYIQINTYKIYMYINTYPSLQNELNSDIGVL